MKKRIKVVFGAGGTGGHLFPATVINAELEARGARTYLITDARGKKYAGGFDRISTIVGGQWSGEGIWRRAKTLCLLALGTVMTMWHMIRIRPDVVIGMGGYISVPVVVCGWLLRRKTIIFNADAVLGNANIFLRRFAGTVATAFPDVAEGASVVGLPVREDILKAADTPYNPKGAIVVMGGSQGAQLLSEVVPVAIAQLKNPPYVFHQARPEDIHMVRTFYRSHDIPATVESFFTNPAELLEGCALFIGRAGANTVYEVGTVGRPAIFVPIEHLDQQQVRNAEKIAAKGGALIIREGVLTPKMLAGALTLVLKPKTLEKMAKSAKVFGNKNAAEAIADLALGPDAKAPEKKKK